MRQSESSYVHTATRLVHKGDVITVNMVNNGQISTEQSYTSVIALLTWQAYKASAQGNHGHIAIGHAPVLTTSTLSAT